MKDIIQIQVWKDKEKPYYSEEFMFEFAKWCARNYMRLTETWIKIQDYGESSPVQIFTTKELLEEFKKSKDAVSE